MGFSPKFSQNSPQLKRNVSFVRLDAPSLETVCFSYKAAQESTKKLEKNTIEYLNSIVQNMSDKMSNMLSNQHQLISLLIDKEETPSRDFDKFLELHMDNSKLQLENQKLRDQLAKKMI